MSATPHFCFTIPDCQMVNLYKEHVPLSLSTSHHTAFHMIWTFNAVSHLGLSDAIYKCAKTIHHSGYSCTDEEMVLAKDQEDGVEGGDGDILYSCGSWLLRSETSLLRAFGTRQHHRRHFR